MYNEDRYIDTSNKAVLITGCDSGFGHLAAELFASRGVHVFAGCLTNGGVDMLNQHGNNIRSFLFDVTKKEDTTACLEMISGACRENGWGVDMLNQHGNNIRSFLFDVTKKEDTTACLEMISGACRENGWECWGVVANAGVTNPIGPADWFQFEDYFRVINVNLLGHIRTVLTFLPLVKRSKGRIVITVSIAGHFSMWGMGPYCSSKFGLQGFADSLRCDLKSKGVHVATVVPEFYPTNIVNTEGQVEAGWEKLSNQLKSEYSLDEMLKNRNEIKAKIDANMRNNKPIEVAEAYFHATFGAVPRLAYFMGSKNRFYEFVKKWPDYLVSYFVVRGVPAANKK